MKYITMVCDIKSSKTIKDREQLQFKIIEMLKETNKLFHTEIASPFIITLGDEWQGLLHEKADYEKYIDYFKGCLKEVEFYCGIGIGEISIHNYELTVNQLDGPAFYMARKAIGLAKANKYSLVLIKA